MSAWKHKEIIGDCTLYLGDCMDVMPTLSRHDMLFTDPPYRLVSGGNTTGEMGGCFSRDRYDNSGEIVPCDIEWGDWIPLLQSVMADPSHGYIMCNNRHVANCQNEVEKAGFHFHNLLAWDKGTATPNRWYMKNLEFTVFFSKGKAFHVSDCGQKQLIRCPQKDVSDHLTEKPVLLVQTYIGQSTKGGQSVLDPFMGSGTTGVACVKLGRKFTGIEIDPDYFDMACQRVQSACDDTHVFIDSGTREKQQQLSIFEAKK